MQIAPLLRVGCGVTALIGGGGKTTLMETLAGELESSGRGVMTTTTHIRRPAHCETLMDATEDEVRTALARCRILCVAGREENGKLCAPGLPLETLARLADYVIVGTVEEVVPKLIKYYKANNK